MRILTAVRSFLSLERRHWFLTRILVLLSGSFGSALLAFAIQLVLAHALSVADYGRMVALLAIVNVIGSFASYGIGLFWLELFGREGWTAVSWTVPTTQMLGIAAATSAGLLTGYVVLTDDGSLASSSTVAVFLVLVLLGQGLSDTTTARLQIEERYFALAGWQSLTQFGRSLVVAFIMVRGFTDLIHLLAGYALVGLITTTISAISLYQVRRGRIALVGHGASAASRKFRRHPPLRKAFTEATPYCFCTIFYLVYSQGVVAIVERAVGREAAAMYNVAFVIVAGVYLIPSVVYSRYLVSKIFRWWAQDRRMFAAVFHLGVMGNAVLGMTCMLAVIASAPLGIPILFGSRYAAAVPILLLLSTGIPVRFIQHTYGAAFFSRENIKRKVLYLGVAAFSCLVLSLLLIPRFGVDGAAVSSVLAEVTLLLLYAKGAARYVDSIDIHSTFSLVTIRSSLAYIGRSGNADR